MRFPLVVLFVVSIGAACSEVREEPEDCRADQYFDDGRDICRTCPAVELPECPSECGFNLSIDTRGCQVAECSCGVCNEGQYYDRELLSCRECIEATTPACREGCPEVGETTDDLGCPQTVCDCGAETECPPVVAIDCGAAGCCDEVAIADEEGCPQLTCECPEEAPEGFFFDDEDVCQDCESVEEPPASCEVVSK